MSTATFWAVYNTHEEPSTIIEIEGVQKMLAGGYRVYALKNKVMGFQPHPSSTNQRWRTVYVRN